MASGNQFVVIDDLTGGLNTTDPPLALAANECAQAINIEWVRCRFGRRRHGSAPVVSAFYQPESDPPADPPVTPPQFYGPIGSMCRYVPGVSESAAEVWAVASNRIAAGADLPNLVTPSPIFGRKAGSSAFVVVEPDDALTGHAWDVTWATVDGKLFVAYKSAVNRLHVWDGTRLRRTGIDPGAGLAPVITNQGGGTYAAVLRYYRARYYDATTGRVSEATASVAFTPSGSGVAARVHQPITTVPGFEGATWWIVEASDDNVTFYQIATLMLDIVPADGYYDDTLAPSVYDDGAYVVSPLTGTFQLQKSYRFLAGADNRLLGFGTFADPPLFQNRIEISDIVGGTTLGAFGAPAGSPAEYINTTAGWYIDLDESDSGEATGLKGPVGGNYYAFKKRQLWELRPTGNAVKPFDATALSKTIGSVSHQAIVVGEDETGRGALYFWSHKGPYRYGVGGLEYLGKNIEGLFKDEFTSGGWLGDINLEAAIRVAHAIWHSDNRQVYWWVAVGAADEPNLVVVFHTETSAWSVFIGLAPARCSAMLPARQGMGDGFTMSRDLKPHCALAWDAAIAAGGRLMRCDDDDVTVDVNLSHITTALTTRPVVPGGPGHMGNVGDVQIIATGAGVQLTLETFPNLSAYPNTQRDCSVNLTPTFEEQQTWVYRRFEDSGLGEVLSATYRISELTDTNWVVDRLIIPVRQQGQAIA